MAVLEPRLAILDETDSGLDIDALRIVADGVNALRSPDRAFLRHHPLPAAARLHRARLRARAGRRPHRALGRQGAGPRARGQGLRLARARGRPAGGRRDDGRRHRPPSRSPPTPGPRTSPSSSASRASCRRSPPAVHRAAPAGDRALRRARLPDRRGRRSGGTPTSRRSPRTRFVRPAADPGAVDAGGGRSPGGFDAAARLVFVNGRFAPRSRRWASCPAAPSSAASPRRWRGIPSWSSPALGQHASFEHHPFVGAQHRVLRATAPSSMCRAARSSSGRSTCCSSPPAPPEPASRRSPSRAPDRRRREQRRRRRRDLRRAGRARLLHLSGHRARRRRRTPSSITTRCSARAAQAFHVATFQVWRPSATPRASLALDLARRRPGAQRRQRRARRARGSTAS